MKPVFLSIFVVSLVFMCTACEQAQEKVQPPPPPPPVEESEEPEEPFEEVLTGIPISTAAELAAITDFTGDYYLTADIDLSDLPESVTFHPLGTSSSPFSGTIYGNNKTIRNLTLTSNENNNSLVAWLGETGVITHLHLRDVQIQGRHDIGGMVGHSAGHILHSSVTGSIQTTARSTGGLVGYMAGGIVSNCSVTVNVYGADYYIGGLAGYVASGSKIEESHAQGNVTTTSVIAGGLAGYIDSIEIVDCTASGDVSGWGTLGGLVGESRGAVVIRNSSASGRVEADGSNSYAGGLVGSAGHVNAEGTTRIEDCTATGLVAGAGSYVGGMIGYLAKGEIVTSSASGAVTGSMNVGGLAGLVTNDSVVRQSFASGTIESDSPGVSDVGGLIGRLQSGSIVEFCYATGSILCAGGGVGGLAGYNGAEITNSRSEGHIVANGYFYAGGLAGRNDGTITHSHASGNVTAIHASSVGGFVGYQQGNPILDSYATGIVVGSTQTGGFVGHNTLNKEIERCYATGAVNASGNMSGGFAGNNDGTISQCFASGSVSGSGDSTGGFVGNNGNTIHNSYALGSVTGARYTGGFVGRENGDENLSRCYAIGSVVGTSDLGPFVGKLASMWDRAILCFYPVTSGYDNGNNSDYGFPLGAGALKVASMFTDWDFTTIWQMDSTIHSGYPSLRAIAYTDDMGTVPGQETGGSNPEEPQDPEEPEEPVVPAAPSNVTVGNETTTSLTISWNSVDGASGYTVYRANSSNGPFIAIANDITDGTSYEDTGLSPSSTYWYAVSSLIDQVESERSVAVDATTLAEDTEGPVILLRKVSTVINGAVTGWLEYLYLNEDRSEQRINMYSASGELTQYTLLLNTPIYYESKEYAPDATHVSTTTRTYDTDGRELSMLMQIHSRTSEGIVYDGYTAQYSYQYDARGNRVRSTVMQSGGPIVGTNMQEVQTEYDAQDRPVKVTSEVYTNAVLTMTTVDTTVYSGSASLATQVVTVGGTTYTTTETAVIYDSNGRAIETTQYYYLSEENKMFMGRTVVEYNDMGFQTESRMYDEEGMLLQRMTITYGSDGQILEYETVAGVTSNKTVYEYY